MINHLAFNKNRITKKWNILCLFENSCLKVFQYTFLPKEEKFNFEIAPLFVYNFNIDPDLMRNFPGLGTVVTSYTGDIFIFVDHSTSDSGEFEESYMLFHKSKLSEKCNNYSITTSCFS